MSLSDDICTDPSDYSDIQSSSNTLDESDNDSINSESSHVTMDQNTNHSQSYTKHPTNTKSPNTLQKDLKEEKDSDIDNDPKRMKLETQNLDCILAQTLSVDHNLGWNYRDEWCRYCGARASVSFHASPWGTKQLCHQHHILWIRNQLDLSSFTEPSDIESAINPAQCTEKQYLIDILMKYDSISDSVRRRSSRIKHKTHQIQTFYSDEDDDESYSCASISNESGSENYVPSTHKIRKLKTDRKPRRNRVFKQYECSDCRQIFISPTEFARHSKAKHKNHRPFICTKCPKTYLKAAALDCHIRKIHEKEVNYHCQFCDKAFFDGTSYRIHCKTHAKPESETAEDADSFSCNQCQRVFKYKYYLKRHVINMHTPNEEKPYQCVYCPYGAATKKQIVWHENIHRNERKYKCEFCEMRFNNKKDVKHHIANRHTKPHKCPICDNGFGTKSYLQGHIIAVHAKNKESKTLKCDYCAFTAKSRSIMRNHELSHAEEMPFKCGKCGERFQLLSYLHAHITKQHDVKHSKKMKNKKKKVNAEEIEISQPKKPKDVHSPKRPLNAFFIYASDVRANIKLEFVNDKKIFTQQEVAREIGKRWQLLKSEKKKKYKEMEEKVKAEYKISLEQYRHTKQYKEYEERVKEWKEECNKRKMKRWNKNKQCIVDYRSSSSSSSVRKSSSGEYTESNSDSDESSFYD